MEEKVLKSGTTTVGLVAKDGIVLATDKRATAGYLIVDKKAKKIHKITDSIALTIAGSVSDAQKIISWLRTELKLLSLKVLRDVYVTEAAHLLANIVYYKVREFSMIESIAHFIIGGKDRDDFKLYDVFPDGSITPVDDFVSSGSGSVFAYGVLETNYNNNLRIDDAIALAARAVNAALQRDIASGNGIEILTITNNGIEYIESEKINKLLNK